LAANTRPNLPVEIIFAGALRPGYLLRHLSKSTLKSLVIPGGLFLLGVMLLMYSGWLTLALPALSFLYYCALAGGMLLAWRFHSSRIFLSLVVLFLAGQAIAAFGEQHSVAQALAMAVPIDFVLIALMPERGFTVESMTPIALFLFVQSVVVAVLSSGPAPSLPIHQRHPAALAFPRYALVMFAASGIFLLVRFLVTRKPGDCALLWSLGAFILSLRFVDTPRTSIVYAATAACILATSIIENSYLLAYHDELTTLPSRRAFNDALLRLQQPYSIAVVDIDHFKKFNDTYGHDIGDQVLRLVASNLAHVTGGGRAYRCGGEEFTILFPGKTTAEVIEHLEQLRANVESSEFHLRGADRRQAPRGPERRNGRTRGRARKGDAIRQLAREKPATTISVTVSIGVATSVKQAGANSALQAADKALYRAKANGRNRVESAALRRTQSKAAGIA